MSLRTDFTGGLDTAVNAAIVAGEAFVTTNYAAIQSAITSASGLGKTTVTFSANEAHNPAGMILQGTVWNAYASGVKRSLIGDDIMDSEITVAIAAIDASTNQVTITLTF